MMEWSSQRESKAEHFQQRAQSVSSYMLSSRASRKLREQCDQANDQIDRFKEEIQKRFLLSVANKFYSFPFTELSFDNPVEDADIKDLIGKSIICLYAPEEDLPPDSIDKSKENQSTLQSKAKITLQSIRAERSKLSEILQLINNRRKGRIQERDSRSKEKKMGYKYGVINQEDELLRKRLYTQPNQKQAGFIKKK